jgi:hypothetical protein
MSRRTNSTRKVTEGKSSSKKRQKEQRKRCWQTFKLLRKGNISTGGLSHVLKRENTDPPSISRIQTQEQLDPTLLDRNIVHFSQEEGTPFTTEQLISIIWEDGCSACALDILEGIIPPNIFQYPKLFLTEMKKTRKTLPLNMTIDDMCRGFQKWRENTTTSPSGKHLGIYKSLVNARRYNLLTDKEDTTFNNNNNNTLSIAEQCLQIQFFLITLAISHCHTFKRWKTVHNFLLEKIPVCETGRRAYQPSVSGISPGH